MEMKKGPVNTAPLLMMYLTAVAIPVLVLIFTGGTEHIVPFHIAARFVAVSAFTMLLLQPVLSARFKWIERLAGLDRLLAFHRITGITAAFFAFLHPILLALGSRSTAILTKLDLPWYISAGRITLIILLIYGAAAVFRAGLKIPFQLWLRLHNSVTPVIITGAFLHSWFTAVRHMPDPLRAVWFVIPLLSLFSYLHLTVYQRLSARKNPFIVSSVSRITANVWEILMTPPEGKKLFQYLPGQFLFVTFLRGRGLPVEEHPFTISSSPSETDHIAVTIKESGDFTSSIGRTKAGDRAAVLAPYGRFSHLLHPDRPRVVFIAGGIGVTPLLSMIRYMAHLRTEKDILLFYCNRTEADIAFKDELDAIAGSDSSPDLRIVHILSNPGENWTGEKGRISGATMKKYLGDMGNTGYYVCGPPPMMNGVEAALLSSGVADSNIHMEKFSL